MGRKREASVLISKMHRGRRHFAFQNTCILVEVKLRITMRAPNTLKQKNWTRFSRPPPKKGIICCKRLSNVAKFGHTLKKKLDIFVMLGQVLSTVFPKLVAINAKSFLGWSPLSTTSPIYFLKRAAAALSSFLLLLLLPSPPPLLLNKKQG